MTTITRTPEHAVAYLRAALNLIGTKCESFYGASTCVENGRSPYARYGEDLWCDSCIARTALNGDAFPAWGTNGCEERPELKGAVPA